MTAPSQWKLPGINRSQQIVGSLRGCRCAPHSVRQRSLFYFIVLQALSPSFAIGFSTISSHNKVQAP